MIYTTLDYKNATLRGFLHIPKKKKYDLFIYFHGFTGSKIDQNHMASNMAKKMCSLGYGFLRMDFYGTGDSDGDFYQMTLSEEIEQAKYIIKYAKTLDNINNIHLIGHSMGGLVSINVVSNVIDKIILLAPAIKMGDLTNVMCTKDKYINEYDGYEIGGLIVGRCFVNDVKTVNNKILFDNKTLVVHGDADDVCLLDDSIELCGKYDNLELSIIRNTGHCFEDYNIRMKIIEEIIKFVEVKWWR
ncbi:MAG: alpha/beta hydrolase family protein [Mycoplasmatales bacterium]